MPLVWSKIAAVCRARPMGPAKIWVTEGDDKSLRWVVGTYDALRGLAPKLRDDSTLWQPFANHHARVGRRHDDAHPTKPRVHTRFRALLATTPAIPDSAAEMAERARRTGPNSGERRITDVHVPAALYFADGTLEAHHIVEKSILGELGLNNGDLDNAEAPCVLVSPELHRRFFTPVVSPARSKFSKGMAPALRTTELDAVYNALYSHAAFGDLKKIVGIIRDAL